MTLGSCAIAQPPFGGGGPFGGGPPPFGGGEFGAPPWGGGGFGGRGGRGESGRGESESGRGEGWRGGFDPAGMLARMDVNGNKMIDPDEAQGPARFMLDRLARDNSDIDLSKPIPLSKITEAFEKSRGGRSGFGGGFGGSEGEEGPPPTDEKKTLVPGFGRAKELEPVPGFGSDADVFAVKVEERDLKEAEDRINRYDKNKDGALDEAELKDGRWNDSPMQYDRNRDKKLTKQELAVRYARRRTNDSSRSSDNDKRASNDSRRGGWSDGNSADKPNGEPQNTNPWKNQASYRTTPKNGKLAKIQGLPEWFMSNDQNGDGQVMMNEFSSSWDFGMVEEFNRFDSNRDGSITAAECLAAVKKGILRGIASPAPASSSTGSSGSTSSGIASMASSSSSSSSRTSSSGGDIDLTSFDPADIPQNPDERWMKFTLKKWKIWTKIATNGSRRMNCLPATVVSIRSIPMQTAKFL